MIYSLLAITLAQLLALGTASPQVLEDNQLCHEADGRVSDTRWAELFGIFGVVSSQPGAVSAYTFVINEYDGHYLVRQNGCYQTVLEASDLMNQETLCFKQNAFIGGLDTDVELFKSFSRQLQREASLGNETMSLVFPSVTGIRDFTVVVDTNSTQSEPISIRNAYWLCDVSDENEAYNECLWRPTREASDWRVQPYTWNAIEEEEDSAGDTETETETEDDDFF